MSKVNEDRPHRGEEATNPERSLGNLEELPADSAIKRSHSHSKTIAANAAKRTRAGQAIIDSEAKYRSLFEAAQDGILILNPKTGVIVDVNPFLIKLLDYPRSYFFGKALWEIGLFSDIEASRNAFHRLKDKGYVRYEDLLLKNKDGQAINVEFVSNVYGVKSKQFIQCNVREVTARKRIEQSGQRLLQAQKMEAVSQLAAGVAHDFNNLLQVILGYGEILQQRQDLPEPILKMVAKIQDAGADIELENLLDHDLGTIEADPHQIEQVLMNLAINARDAMPEGGKIIFETTNIVVDEAYDSQHVRMKPGRYVMLTVRDTGAGMDSETQTHAFDPFFTTKATDQGTGLGLSTVFSIVKQSGGAISVYSERNHGTTFTIHFPRRDEAPIALRQQRIVPLRGGTETILLVDDAPSLRKLLRILLETRGYTVLDSADPSEALRIARDHKGPLPLMITDNR